LNLPSITTTRSAWSHGGLAATLLDSAMAVPSIQLCRRVRVTPIGNQGQLPAGMSAETGLVRCEANIIHVGGRTAVAEGKILDQKNKLYAHGTTTCIVFRPAA